MNTYTTIDTLQIAACPQLKTEIEAKAEGVLFFLLKVKCGASGQTDRQQWEADLKILMHRTTLKFSVYIVFDKLKELHK